MTRARLHVPRRRVTAEWLAEQEANLALLGLRIARGIYTATTITLIAVKA